MDNFDVKFEETLSAFNVHPSETDNSFNAEGDSVIVIPQGGEGKIQSILVNGEEQPIVDKKVDIKVPTKTSQLTNDSGFITKNDLPENTGGIDEYVKTTKTINSLETGDTIFKGDTIYLNGSGLEKYLSTYTPKTTHLYFVNKDTGNGFRFDCYIRYTDYFLGLPIKADATIQIHYIENENITTIFEKTENISTTNYGKIETEYSFVNNYKDITNLYIYFTSSDKDLKGQKHENIDEILGITAQRISTVQDTLLNSKDGVETPIDGFVKVKVNNETNLPSKLVQIVGNKEKEIPINEEVDKKLGELENKVNNSHVVDIKKFILDGNAWISEEQLKKTTPSEDKSTYIAQKDNELYYYTYRDIKTNVGFNIASSYFKEATIGGKSVYTSSKQSYNRDATGLQLDKRPLDISSVSFDLYMTGLGSTNQYFPEIAFVVDEGTRREIDLQFTCWNKWFQLKLIRTGADTITVNIPYSNDTFNSNIKIEIKNNVLIVYIDNEVFSTTSLDVIYPELYDFRDLENIYFGLRYDKTPPTWGFSNVVFEKQYWEDGYKIQGDTLYVNLEDNTLYRYVKDSTTKPYPNFISVKPRQGLCVDNVDVPFGQNTVIKKGDTIKIDIKGISDGIAFYGSNGEHFYFYPTGYFGNVYIYGWNYNKDNAEDTTSGQYFEFPDGYTISGTYSFVYNGEDTVIIEGSNTDTLIVSNSREKAIYEKDKEIKELDISMLSDKKRLLDKETVGSKIISLKFTGTSNYGDQTCELVTEDKYYFTEGKSYIIRSSVKNQQNEDVMLTVQVVNYSSSEKYSGRINLGSQYQDNWKYYEISLLEGNLIVAYTTEWYFTDDYFSAMVTIQEL